MPVYRVIKGVPYVMLIMDTEWQVDQAIRQMTTYQKGSLGLLVRDLLVLGLPALDDLPEDRRNQLLTHRAKLKVRLSAHVPVDLDQGIRYRARIWNAPIYRVFTEALKLGMSLRNT